MGDEDLPPAEQWEDPGQHGPDHFIETEPEPDRTTHKGEEVELILRPEGGQPELEECPYNVSVLVLQTPMFYLTELQITDPNTSNSGLEKTFQAGDVRRLAKQMKNGEAPKLENKLGEKNVDIVSDYLLAGANMASTAAIDETLGVGNIEALREGKITEEEFEHEIDRKLSKEREND